MSINFAKIPCCTSTISGYNKHSCARHQILRFLFLKHERNPVKLATKIRKKKGKKRKKKLKVQPVLMPKPEGYVGQNIEIYDKRGKLESEIDL